MRSLGSNNLNLNRSLHLVFGGELVSPEKNVFRDVSKIHLVGIFPDYETAFLAWKPEAQRTVDNPPAAQGDDQRQ